MKLGGCCCWLAEGVDEPRNTSEMKWSEGWDENDVVAELWDPCQELDNLEGCRPHIPRGQVRGMSGAAEKVGHCMAGDIGTGGVIGPAYGLTVGLKPRAMARTELPYDRGRNC